MNKKKVIFVLLVFLIIIISIVNLVRFFKEKSMFKNSDTLKNIVLSEELMLDGTVENFEDLKWNNVSIKQFNNELDLKLNFTGNFNDNDFLNKIKYKKFTIKLFDKKGNILCSKDIKGDTFLSEIKNSRFNIKFDVDDFKVVYNIRITAK